MSKLSNGKTSLVTQQEYYGLVQKHSVNALRNKKNKLNNNYHQEIKQLSHYCATLINLFSESPQSIVICIETALIATHGMELKAIDDEIKQLFNRRKYLPVDNAYCEREITDLTFKINELEQKKLIPITELIQSIIFDTLDSANKSEGINISPKFNLNSYQKPSVPLFL